MHDERAGTTAQQPNPVMSLLSNGIPKITKVLAITLGVSYILGLLFGSKSLALVPGFTIGRYYIWNVFTAGFFDNSFLNTIISIVGVVLFGAYLEPIWGSQQFLLFVIIVNLFSGIATFLSIIFMYLFTGFEALLFSPFCGFNGVLAAFSVAIKQLMPEQQLSFFFVSVRAKQIPMIFIIISLIMGLLTANLKDLPFVVFGVVVGWVYLRFYQDRTPMVGSSSSSANKVYGDPSESFSFASFFPEPIRPFVSVVSNVVFKVVSATGAIKRYTRSKEALAAGSGAGGAASAGGGRTLGTSGGHRLGSGSVAPRSSLPGVNPSDSERRRNLALRALESRLGALESQAPVSLTGSDDEADENPTAAAPVRPKQQHQQQQQQQQSESVAVVVDSGAAPASSSSSPDIPPQQQQQQEGSGAQGSAPQQEEATNPTV